MNPSEKRMIAILGVLMALLAGWTVKTQYVKKLDSLDRDLRDRGDVLKKIYSEQQRLSDGKAAWSQAGRQTLSLTDSEAQTVFRPDIDALVQEVGLSNSTVQIKGVTRKGTNDLRSLNCTVVADGKLSNILNFFYKLHQRPYAARCQVIRLARSTDNKTPKDILRMTVDIDTLLLPDGKKILPAFSPVNLASRPASQPAPSKLATLDSYNEIVRKKIFQRYEPPIPPPDKVVGHRPGNNGTHIFNQALAWNSSARAKTYDVYMGDKPDPLPKVQTVSATSYQPPQPLTQDKTYYWRVDATSEQGTTRGDAISFRAVPAPKIEPPPLVIQPPPPPLYENMVLARIVGWPDGRQAVLEDPASKTAAAKRVEVGEPFFEGTLVLVHPKGAVSQSDREGNRGLLRFHAISKALKEGVPLTEETQPILWDEVMKLEARSKGISQRPG